MRPSRPLLSPAAEGGQVATSAGLLVLRVFAGVSLALAHGLGKLPPSARFVAGVGEMGFPFPLLFAWAAALSEFGGGLLLAAGLLSRPAALFIAITMGVAAFVRQAGDPFVERELALLYGAVAVTLLLTGAGRYSVDARLARRGARASAASSNPDEAQRMTRIGQVLVLALVLAGCADSRAADPVVRIGFVAGEGERAARTLRGAELAAEEAGRAAELVGRRFALLTTRAAAPADVPAAVRELAGRGALAVVGGFDEAGCRALAEAAAREGILFLNVGCPQEALRDPRRLPAAFHVEASEAMYHQLRAGAADSAAGAAAPVLWHDGLRRYGAAQLNDRFRRRFRQPPGAPEWAGWFAVKALWEGALRAGSTEPRRLAAVLASDSTRFDGHKGEPLGFDRRHQLRQPLYRPGAAGAGGAETGEAGPSLPTLAEAKLGAGPHLFVSNEGSGDVTVIDAAAQRAVARIPVGLRPRGIQLDAAGRRLYVALSDDSPTAESDADAIAVVDLGTGRLAARHSAGSDPEQFALSPDGRTLYAANEDAGTATLTRLGDGEVLQTLTVGIEPEGVAVSPDGRWVYVTAETSNTVSVIDTRSREIAASFLVDVRPRAAAFSPDGRRAYVSNEISGTVSVVDPATHQVVGTVELGEAAKPVGVAVSPDGRRVYVANGHGHSVAVIDAASRRVLATVPVGRRPWGIAVSPDGSRVYTANGGSDDVSVIDTGTLRVVTTIPVGARPWGVAVGR